MEITYEQAQNMLNLPKKIVENDKLLDKLIIHQKFPFFARFELVTESNYDLNFLWEIKQSKKNRIRISLHYQDNDSKIGLLRVDYNGGHKNPEFATEHVPEKLRPFTGKEFTIKEHHIHYHVQGYSSLAWAIPLTEDDFVIKEINDNEELNSIFANTIKLFAKTINIETEISINELLL